MSPNGWRSPATAHRLDDRRAVFHLTAPPQEDRREPPPPSPSCAEREPEPLPLFVVKPDGATPEATDIAAADNLTVAPAERPPPVTARSRPVGLIVSLVAHALILLFLIDWPQTRPIEATPIPVQLVLEPPPPEPPPAPTPAPPKPEPKPPPEVKPPPGRLASEDIGNPEAKPADAGKEEAATPPEAPKPKPDEPAAGEKPKQTAAIIPPPEPPKPEPPKPAPPKEERAAKPPPKPRQVAMQPPRQPENRAQPQRRGAIPGPAATRNEYLAYLASLVRRHLNLLPLAVVGGRSGETVIDILVLDDGTIAMLRVGRSSGYPDIDVRVEKMIAAVGRFPPLPQWFQGPSMQLEFRLKFPEALIY
jgi:outer membrane biosynthesis protein TonB